MKLAVFKETPARLPIRRMQRLFNLVVRRQGRVRAVGQINLIICSDVRIRNLNRRFRGIDHATDVLSFDLGSAGADDQVVGELYMSAPCVQRQARQSGNGLYNEYLLLLCHGLLHLFGYDHDTVKREQAMFKLQAGYLDELRPRG